MSPIVAVCRVTLSMRFRRLAATDAGGSDKNRINRGMNASIDAVHCVYRILRGLLRHLRATGGVRDLAVIRNTAGEACYRAGNDAVIIRPLEILVGESQ